MRRLVLVRHAKSSRDEPTLADRDRPLNERGLRDAPKMGERLAKRDIRPDLIVSSPAVRALTTAQLMAQKLGYDQEAIVMEERVYAATPDALVEVIRALGDRPKCVMLVGHNPELSELARRWSKGLEELPTCAVADFRFDIKSWSKLGAQKPVDMELYEPKKS
jgi:phosphohistidine phosphatase